MLRTALFFLATLLIGFVQAQDCNADIESVVGQVGETVIFCGTPTEVRASSKADGPVYLNFGGKYPDIAFSVVIFGDVAGSDRDKLVKRFSGKQVRVSGMVKDHNGKPEIILKNLQDLEEQ
ncbi:MAG: hypothetical protein LKM36_01665 [Flavobacteriales bacterium]|jgi:hypothetical protein|nr:hypothetical protein [Flavobacteriales bacterium]